MVALVSDQSPTPASTPVTRAVLVACLASGNPLDLSSRDESMRVISGSLLRAVLLDGDLDRDPRGLTILGARIPDHLDLSYCTLPAPLRLLGAQFSGVLRLQGATIIGELNLTGAELRGKAEDGYAVVADRLQVQGSVFLGQLKVAEGSVRLPGASIAGQLNMAEAELNGKDMLGDALVANGLQVKGDVCLDQLKVARGAVRLLGACITGQLGMAGAELNGKDNDGNALIASGLEVHEGAFLNHLKVGVGAVVLQSASVSRQLAMTAAELHGQDEDGNALVADGLQVNGAAFLDQLQVTLGAVRLLRATINGQLMMTWGDFNGQDNNDDALVADGLRVNGDALLNHLHVAVGAVRLPDATIAGQLNLSGAELNGEDSYGRALVADRLQVAGEAILDAMRVAAGSTVSLRNGRLGSLVLEEYVPRGGWHQHAFLGLQYEHVRGGPAKSASQGAHLLANEADEHHASQPYWQLADYYAKVGNDSAARRLRVWSNVLQARAHPRSWPRFFYGLTTGFGYYPFIAVVWLALLIGFDAGQVNAHRDDFVSTRAPAISAPVSTSQESVTSSRCDSRYPCLAPVLYATDTVLPVISLGQQDAWRLDTSRTGAPLQVILYATTGLGWVLTTLLIGGVSGLLRRT